MLANENAETFGSFKVSICTIGFVGVEISRGLASSILFSIATTSTISGCFSSIIFVSTTTDFFVTTEEVSVIEYSNFRKYVGGII